MLLLKGDCGFLRREWLRLAVKKKKFDDDKSADGKNAEKDYQGVGKRSFKICASGLFCLSMCC